MTTATDTITAAYRESQIVSIFGTPTTLQQSEALPLLNQVLLAAIGTVAGQELSDLNIGGDFDQSAWASEWIPDGARLILNLSGARTLNLHPHPYEGQRLGVVDAGGNLSACNLTLNGNGRTIEGATTLTLSTDGDTRQWMYRSDTADWVKLTALASGDSLPFPQEFDSYFVTRLAMRLNPRNSVATAQETAAELAKTEGRMRARYRKPRPVQDMPHGLLGSRREDYALAASDFNAGRPWRW